MRTLGTTVPFGFDFDTARWIDAYYALGCRSGQFYRNPDNPPEPREARHLAERTEFPFDSIHGLFGHDIDPSSPDDDHRTHCLRVYEDEARLALDLGCSAVVVHPSAYTDGFVPIEPPEADRLQNERWGNLEDFLARLAEVGARRSVVFLIENLPRNAPLGHDPIALSDRILRTDSPWVRMCLDTGHAHLTGDLAHAVTRCAPALGYLHIHDNDASADQHLLPGEGTIDWAAFARALHAAEFSGVCMFEVFHEVETVSTLARDGAPEFLRRACSIE